LQALNILKEAEVAEAIPVPEIVVLESGRAQPQQKLVKSADLRSVRVEEFFRSRELAANTRKAYERELQQFMLWTDKPWHDVTHRDLDRYKAYLQSSPSARGGKPAAAAVIKAHPSLHPVSPI